MAIVSVRNRVIFFVISTALLAGIYSHGYFHPASRVAPSDALIERTFNSRRSQLARLRQMATEDMQKASYFSKSEVYGGLPAPRRQEYKNLLNLLPGVQFGTVQDGTVEFFFAGDGTAISPSWGKGIEFIPVGTEASDNRKASLDNCPEVPEGMFLKEIGPGWFLFCEFQK